MKVICYTSSTLRKRKNKKAKKRKACSTFSSLERKGKGRKLCLPTSSFCLRFFTVYRNTQRIDLHPEARYEFRPAILFFELSGESEVVLWGILFWSVYGHMWGMDFPPQNEMWTTISPCIFFESGWDTEVVFGCSVIDWTVCRHTFRKDWAPKDGICAQTDQSLFLS